MAATSSSQSLIENGTYALDCQVDANPTPTFIWYKNDIQVNTSTYMSLSSHSSRIILSNVSNIDTGNYKCFSQNTIGNVTSPSINIIVYSKYATSIIMLPFS